MGLGDGDPTPACAFCGDEHIGVMIMAYALLRGSYVVPPDLGYEVFVLDPDLGAEFIRLPNGMQAIILSVSKKSEASYVVHERCAGIATEGIVDFQSLAEDSYAYEEDDPDEEDGLPY